MLPLGTYICECAAMTYDRTFDVLDVSQPTTLYYLEIHIEAMMAAVGECSSPESGQAL